MKKIKFHQLYFPFAMMLALSPMVLRSIHQDIKPTDMTRSIASVTGAIHSHPEQKPEEKKEEVIAVKYEKEVFEKDSAEVIKSLSAVEKQLLDVVLKKDKEFEQSLHDAINEQFAKIEELKKIEAESEADKKIIADKVSELSQIAGDLCDRLEKVAASTKYEDKKEEKKEEKVADKAEDCDLQQKYTELSKQVESMTADHKKYLDVIVGMNQMMISMFQNQQQQQSPYTYSYGPFGPAYYPYNNMNGLGQVTNNYYYGNASGGQSPQIMNYGQYSQNPMDQQMGIMSQGQGQQQQNLVMPQTQGQQMQTMQGMDPRFSQMNMMPGVFGDNSFMHNFGGSDAVQQPAGMVVDTGRSPAVLF